MRNSHEIVASVANHNSVAVDVKAPSRVEAYVGSRFGWLLASEDGIVVAEGVPWVRREGGHSLVI